MSRPSCGRREFLLTCAGLAVAAGLGRRVLAADGSPVAPTASGMKKAICHYSFHRRYAAEKWTPDRMAQEVKALGIEGIDYHSRYLGSTDDAVAAAVTAAVTKHGLILSSLSLSTNFNKPKAEEMKKEIEATTQWIRFAAKVKAPVSRIFGGSLSAADRKSEDGAKAATQRMIDGVAAVTKEAEKVGLILAIENHGGLPCKAEEQVAVIKTVNSPSLRATVDVGNYLQGGQEGHIGTAIAAPYAAYVHMKDSKKVPDASSPWGYKVQSCVVGEGDVNLAACIEALAKAGYKGFVGLEYEGSEDEATGVPKSVEALKRLVK